MRRTWALTPILVAPLLATSVAATGSSPGTGLAASAAPTAPNIVMLMVDDMRTDELRFMPRTRRLVGQPGATFRNAIVPTAMCCPSRASTLTGLHTHNHGVWSHREPWGFHAFDDRSTLAVWLQAAGYTTAYLGKYLNGYGLQPRPGAETGRSTQYVPPGWDSWRASIDGGLPRDHAHHGDTYDYFDTTLNNDGSGYLSHQGRYQTNVYAELASEEIERLAAAPEPFFSYVSFTAPHFGDPVESDDPGPVRQTSGDSSAWVQAATPARPRRVWDEFNDAITRAPGKAWQAGGPTGHVGAPSDLPPISRVEWRRVREIARQRAESLSVVDEAIGRILGSLAATGELDDTVVVFTSDNGYFLGEFRVRQGKTYPYGPSGRVPLLIRGPGVPAGVTRSDPYLSIDHAPTLAQAAGVTMPYEPDGRSLWDVARTGDQGWTSAVLTEAAPRRPGEPNAVLGVRTGDFFYAAWRGGAEELFDLRSDRAERHNVATDPSYADDLTQLRGLLAGLRDCRAATCRPAVPGG